MFFGPWSNVSNPIFFAFVHVLSLMKHPRISLSYSHCTSGLPPAHFPTLSDLTILPLFHPIFLCSSQCFNSIMDVHKAQFTSRAFSIISLVNSLAVPASPPRVFAEAGPVLSVCVHPAYTLTPSARRPTVVTNYTHLPQSAT